MENISMETALLFVVVLLLAFSCGFFRILKQYFSRRTRRHPQLPPSILIAQIRTRAVQRQNEPSPNVTSIYPGGEQLSPPPYSAVTNILPPSYEEAIKQNAERNESKDDDPKNEGRF